MQRARIDAIQIRSQARTDPWEILNYMFYMSATIAATAAVVVVAFAVAIEGIERAAVTAITLISSLMIMVQGGLVLVNFRFITEELHIDTVGESGRATEQLDLHFVGTASSIQGVE